MTNDTVQLTAVCGSLHTLGCQIASRPTNNYQEELKFMSFLNQMYRIAVRVVPLLVLSLFIVACTPEPETVFVTRVVTEQVEVEITREVEVTRIMEVEMEVTREVEVTQEVTRIVENVVTATPEPTQEPTETPVPTNTPVSQATAVPAATGESQMLSTMVALRTDIEQFGGMIDTAVNSGVISCYDVVFLFDKIAAYPTLDVAGSSALIQNAHTNYRQSISIFTNGAKDMTQNCRDFLANPESGGIPFQQWGAARQQVNTALDALNPAIRSLEG
jgi:hypothetical protein